MLRPSTGSTALLARLQKGETHRQAAAWRLLHHQPWGYAGLYECCKYMTGKSHTDPEANPSALTVMQHMNDKCAMNGRPQRTLITALYGTPLESTTYKFAKCLETAGSAKSGRRFPEARTTSPTPTTFQVYRADRCLHQARSFESGFQKAQPRRCHQLCRGPQQAGQPGSGRQGHAVHQRQHHVRRTEHQERLLPGVRL